MRCRAGMAPGKRRESAYDASNLQVQSAYCADAVDHNLRQPDRLSNFMHRPQVVALDWTSVGAHHWKSRAYICPGKLIELYLVGASVSIDGESVSGAHKSHRVF